MEFTPHMTERHKARYAVRPGLECPRVGDEEPEAGIDYAHARFENDVWKASGGAYGKADSVSPFACFEHRPRCRNSGLRGGQGRSKDHGDGGVGATTMATIIIIIMTSPLNTIRLFGSTKPISASSATA